MKGIQYFTSEMIKFKMPWCFRAVLQDVTGRVRRPLYMRLRCIRMVLQFLMGEKIRFKLCLGCIRKGLQYLTG